MPPARRTPQDRKPKAGQPVAEPVLNDDGTFDYAASDGSTIELPVLALTSGFIRKNRALSDVDLIFTVCELLLDEATQAAVDELPAVEMNRMWAQWTTASRVALPES